MTTPLEGETPRRSRRSPKGERRRREIIEAAVAEFSRNGYRATSVDTIAAAAGISQAGLLHHYPSKEDLLHAVLAELITEGRERATEEVSRDGEGALAYFRALTRQNTAHPAAMRIVAMVGAEALGEGHPAYEEIRKRYETVRELTRSRMREEQARGEIDAEVDVETLGVLVLAVLDGLQLQWLYDSSVDPLEPLRLLERLLLSREP